MEVERRPETPIKVPDMAAQTGSVPFFIPFSVEIINAPHYGKAKIPTVDLYDRTTNPKGHLGVYKAQMYDQDVDDAAYDQFFPTTLV